MSQFDIWGFIPYYLDEDDPRPAAEQFNDKYISGWHSFKRFTFNPKTMSLKYPGDPAMKPLSVKKFRDETIALYESSWVLIVQPDQSWDVARMD